MAWAAVQAEREIHRVRSLYSLMRSCRLCPRECGIERLSGGEGICGSGLRPKVASVTLHHGEEPPISGKGGSGTVFFSGCSLRCVYCQNYPISQLGVGKGMTAHGLALKMLGLQKGGAENVNFVTPTHWAPQAAHAVLIARRKGFSLPVVWNTSGYESVETLALLEGVVDIYLCDFRYSTAESAAKFSSAPDYPDVVEPAIGEMLRQVGSFDGKKGVIIRHLCLPGRLDETREILERIRDRFGLSIPISFMSQFFPAYRCEEYPEINRRLNKREMSAARRALEEAGFEKGWVQEDGLPGSCG